MRRHRKPRQGHIRESELYPQGSGELLKDAEQGVSGSALHLIKIALLLNGTH